MNFEKFVNDSLKANNQAVLDLSQFKQISEANLNFFLSKLEHQSNRTVISEIKFNSMTRLNPKCKQVLSKIEQNIQMNRYPSDQVLNLVANHTYHFNSMSRNIINQHETIRPNGIFTCCVSPNKVSSDNDSHKLKLPKALIEDWKIFNILNEKDYLSIIYLNEKLKQTVISFQGIRLQESDFIEDKTEFVNRLLSRQCICLVYAYLHSKHATEMSNQKGFYLSFTGYHFGAYLAEKCYNSFNSIF